MDDSLIILGGMGPQASLELHRILIDKTAEHVTAPDQFPNILHASIAIPDFISDASSTKRAIHLIQSACHALPLGTSAAIGIACNTAHLLLGEIPELECRQFVSMIGAVCDTIEREGHKKVGILASPFTITSSLYSDALAARGINSIIPHRDEMEELGAIIRAVISGEGASSLRQRLTAIAKNHQARGADVILLGCTELPLIGVTTHLPVVSSLECLAEAMIEHRSSRGKMV